MDGTLTSRITECVRLDGGRPRPTEKVSGGMGVSLPEKKIKIKKGPSMAFLPVACGCCCFALNKGGGRYGRGVRLKFCVGGMVSVGEEGHCPWGKSFAFVFYVGEKGWVEHLMRIPN